MIGLDTNVLVRYILQDDRAQAAKANRAVARLRSDNPGFISVIVLCELNWVLRSAYKIPKADCVMTLERIMAVSVFEIEHPDLCHRALHAYKNSTADFSDYLLREVATAAGCGSVLTFDKKALKADCFEKP